jgi:hypothetical protein
VGRVCRTSRYSRRGKRRTGEAATEEIEARTGRSATRDKRIAVGSFIHWSRRVKWAKDSDIGDFSNAVLKATVENSNDAQEPPAITAAQSVAHSDAPVKMKKRISNILRKLEPHHATEAKEWGAVAGLTAPGLDFFLSFCLRQPGRGHDIGSVLRICEE